MKSPGTALLWEIWQQHRQTIAAIGVLTVAGRILHELDVSGHSGDTPFQPSPLTTLLGIGAFVLLFAVLNYSESKGRRAVGQFPRRLFTLPVTSLRLVSVPLLAGVAAIEILYLVWMTPLSRGDSASVWFDAVLVAGLVVFYLWALWTLERAGLMRLVILGVFAVAAFIIHMLPSFPPTPPPWWRSEGALASLVAGIAIVAFLHAWRHVDRLRSGGAGRDRYESLVGRVVDLAPTRRKGFANAEAAHFWYEWRSSGIVLPGLVAAVVLLVVMPMSWVARSDAAETIRLLLAVLAAPVVLAIPVGIAFSKPTFWSEDLALPAFVAVRPLSSEDLVAVKVKVAAASAVLSWLVVFAFLMTWLPLWANLDSVSRLATHVRTFYDQSVPAVLGIAVLGALTAMFLTWRFLVTRLWSGLSGMRLMLVGGLFSMLLLVMTSFALDISGLPAWLLEDPRRLAPLARIAVVIAVTKFSIAAFAWRRATPRHLRAYLLVWLAATACFLALGMVLWGVVRINLSLDADPTRSLLVLLVVLALIAAPLARIGIAPSWLARNRHR